MMAHRAGTTVSVLLAVCRNKPPRRFFRRGALKESTNEPTGALWEPQPHGSDFRPNRTRHVTGQHADLVLEHCLIPSTAPPGELGLPFFKDSCVAALLNDNEAFCAVRNARRESAS